MLSSIIDGICKKINSAFGDECRIYTESIKQGLREPCFFVQLINPTSTGVVGARSLRTNQFCIQYFPQSRDQPKAECYTVMDKLCLTLDYITANEALVKGTKMRGEFIDGVLNFFVNYDMFVLRPMPIDSMGELESTQVKTKG